MSGCQVLNITHFSGLYSYFRENIRFNEISDVNRIVEMDWNSSSLQASENKITKLF